MNKKTRLNRNLLFIKLGGSLITDKDLAETPNLDIIKSLLQQIKQQQDQNPRLRILIGHGSGSFGHHMADKHGTRTGVYSPQDWYGYQQVWYSARKLNQILIDASQSVGIPVICFPASAAITTKNHEIRHNDSLPIKIALAHGLTPLVYGDVVFDEEIGGTIISTEEIFAGLAKALCPSRILLAGIEAGVYEDYPINTRIIQSIKGNCDYEAHLSGSKSLDVTGGMKTKVELMQSICTRLPGIEIRIFSGSDPENLGKVIRGEQIGTLIT